MSLVKKIKTAISHSVDQSAPSSAVMNERIAVSAFYKAEARGFAPGGDMGDWLDAEAEINSSAMED